MPRQYHCPLCASVLSLDDINPATDLVLCRACGQTGSFQLVSRFAFHTITKPPRCVKQESGFAGETIVTYKRLSPSLLFLIPFTVLWAGITMAGLFTSFRETGFDIAGLISFTPFILASMVLLGAVATLLVMKWQVTLQAGTGRVFVGVGSIGWTRTFTYNRDTVVSMRHANIRVNGVVQLGILIRNEGETDLVFGVFLTDEAKQFIASVILKEVKASREEARA